MMSMLNSGSSVIHYLLLGEVKYGYGSLLFCVGAVGGVTGRIAALHIAQTSGRISVIVFALFAVIALSFIIYVIYLFTEDADFNFASICS